MGLLRVAVLGSPEVSHGGSRLTFALHKAQALLLYLAVEGGLHPCSKLAVLLWPDSEPHVARTALRNALVLLRGLLDDADAQHTHLLSEHELLGLNPQAPLELDLRVVQQAYAQVQRLSAVPAEPQRAALVAQVQHALSLARGPFLDGFWLREETAFDEWVRLQQRQWQVCLQLLCDRLSSWQEADGELEQASATLTRWLALDPLAEEAYRRLMRVHLALGETSAALQVYAACRARLAEALQIAPSAETIALAERIRATEARSPGSSLPHPTTEERRPPSQLVAPLVGRAAAFSQLVAHYQLAQQGQPQVVLVVGEAGIGKTRLANEFAAWARAQGAEVLSGQAFEMGGRLPYQPLVEALRKRLEAESAPEDLLDDLWLAELSRLLPELRVRYPDLPAPTEDELAAKIRLFEAVARLLDALSTRTPCVTAG
jgi:DNA-binding SARP family transcriptional activator